MGMSRKCRNLSYPTLPITVSIRAPRAPHRESMKLSLPHEDNWRINKPHTNRISNPMMHPNGNCLGFTWLKWFWFFIKNLGKRQLRYSQNSMNHSDIHRHTIKNDPYLKSIEHGFNPSTKKITMQPMNLHQLHGSFRHPMRRSQRFLQETCLRSSQWRASVEMRKETSESVGSTARMERTVGNRSTKKWLVGYNP